MKIHVEMLDSVYSEKEIDLISDCVETFENFTPVKISRLECCFIEKSRWRTLYEHIYKVTDINNKLTYWRCYYEEGNTEYCDAQGYTMDDQKFVQLIEVEPYECTITKYTDKIK